MGEDGLDQPNAVAERDLGAGNCERLGGPHDRNSVMVVCVLLPFEIALTMLI